MAPPKILPANGLKTPHTPRAGAAGYTCRTHTFRGRYGRLKALIPSMKLAIFITGFPLMLPRAVLNGRAFTRDFWQLHWRIFLALLYDLL